MKTRTYYYVHIEQADTVSQTYAPDGGSFEYVDRTYYGPFEVKQEAIDYIISRGFPRGSYTCKVINMEIPCCE